MARLSAVDRKIADLESEIRTRQHAIDVLRSVQHPHKPAIARVRKAKKDTGEANGTGVVRA